MILEPVPRLTDEEIDTIRQTYSPVAPYVQRDPYRDLGRGDRRVDVYRPEFVRRAARLARCA